MLATTVRATPTITTNRRITGAATDNARTTRRSTVATTAHRNTVLRDTNRSRTTAFRVATKVVLTADIASPTGSSNLFNRDS